MKEIQLTHGYIALIDDEDYELVSKYKWYAHKRMGKFYAETMIPNGFGGRKKLHLHRIVMGLGDWKSDKRIVDHVDGDTLDNQKSKLRIVTKQQNNMNRRKTVGFSKFKGVSWHKRDKKWIAQIRINTKSIYLGYFDNETEAAKAYDDTAKKYFGQFAKLNF